MTSLELFVSQAKAEVGYQEPSNDGTKYAKYFGDNVVGQAWCAYFVSWCADMAGILTTQQTAPWIPTVISTGSTDAMKSWFDNNRRLFVPSADSTNNNYPNLGDIVFIHNSACGGRDICHVGIVVDLNGTTFTTIEGNYDNSVARVTYRNLASGSATIKYIGSNTTKW